MNAMNVSSTAMILAAGLGTRMRPLTDTLPKPLVPLCGKPLLDHVIARLCEGGAARIVVNVHYHAAMIEQHLATCETPQIIVSDERAQILDSGGGAKKMLAHVDGDAFFLANADTAWSEHDTSNMQAMRRAFNSIDTDILLLLAERTHSIGFEGQGDFYCGNDGLLTRRGTAASAPFAYAGVGIFKKALFDDTPDTPFSLNLLFDRAIAAGRLHGLPLKGTWMHVGTVAALAEAEKHLELCAA